MARCEIAVAGCLAIVLWVSTALGEPCPTHPSADGPFVFDRDAPNCLLGEVESPPRERRPQKNIFNVYCPGRMPMNAAKRVAEAIASGSLKPGGVDVRSDFTKYDLVPMVHADQPVKHRFEYRCKQGGRSTVATHVKLWILPNSWQVPAPQLAKFCRDIGVQKGNVTNGAKMEREYRCDLHLRGGPLGTEMGVAMAQETARFILTRDFQAEARSKNLKVCLLAATNMQCAPCETTDKLTLRMQTVVKGSICPANSIFWTE